MYPNLSNFDVHHDCGHPQTRRDTKLSSFRLSKVGCHDWLQYFFLFLEFVQYEMSYISYFIPIVSL